MRIEYDKDADAAYIYLNDNIGPGEVKKTIPLDPNEVRAEINLDFDDKQRLIGIEVLDASKHLPPEVLLISSKTTNNVYRKLTENERQILDKLLTRHFPGSEIIAKQISSSLVRTINEYKDNWGSLEFKVSSEKKAEVTNRIPVFGIVKDLDGVPIELYLHVKDGKVDELEIVKADNSALKSKLDPNKIKVITDQEIVHE